SERGETDRDPLPEAGAALWHLLNRVSQTEGLILLLDDLDRADDRSRSLWLQIAERSLAEGKTGQGPRFSIVLSTDADEDGGQAISASLQQIGGAAKRQLAGLDPGAILQLLRSMLSTDEVPSGLSELIERTSGGHPGFAIAYARWMAERGYL